MQPLMDTQELARRFNEDEAVWRRYARWRTLRRRPYPRLSKRLRERLDRLAWQRAERECRQIRCIGFPLPASGPQT